MGDPCSVLTRGNLKPYTLQVAWPLGGVVIRALAILIATTSACEVLARTPTAQAVLLPPSTSSVPDVGVQIYQLDQFVRQEGSLDCVIVGSSAAGRGVDPEVLASAFQAKTGRTIRCYNFGTAGAGDEGTAVISQILARNYHPWLMIYAASFRDFGNRANFDMNIPWVRYQQGEFSPDGWLESNLVSYRYYLTYSGYLTNAYVTVTIKRLMRVSRWGQWKTNQSTDVSQSPKRNVYQVQYSEFGRINLSSADMSGLDALFSLRQQGVTIVVAEVPVPPQGLQFLTHGKADYQTFVHRLSDMTGRAAVPLYLADGQVLIPDNGWFDYTHMNSRGAAVYSDWLAQQLAQGVRQGQIVDPAH